MPAHGLISLPSPYPVAETVDRLEALLTAREAKVFARIDQRAAALEVGLEMRPTELLIFGDPKTGTPWMNRFPSLAIDLPFKALAWEAEDGQVWLSYNDPAYLAERHQLDAVPFRAVEALLREALR
jgi:uncharacterized protein (DUF302 family)